MTPIPSGEHEVVKILGAGWIQLKGDYKFLVSEPGIYYKLTPGMHINLTWTSHVRMV